MAERLRETRDLVIARHVRLALDNSTLTEETYADDVRQVYEARTPEHLRRVPFERHTAGGDPYKVLRANAQTVRRQLDGHTVRMAAELEEALVLALPQPFRRACMVELAGRYGLLAVEQPAACGPGAIDQMGHLASDFGRCITALAATIGDGHLCAGDAAGAGVVIRELDEVIARAKTLRAAHVDLLLNLPEHEAARAVCGVGLDGLQRLVEGGEVHPIGAPASAKS